MILVRAVLGLHGIIYASDDAKGKFVNVFVAAWVKVMELGRFDLK